MRVHARTRTPYPARIVGREKWNDGKKEASRDDPVLCASLTNTRFLSRYPENSRADIGVHAPPDRGSRSSIANRRILSATLLHLSDTGERRYLRVLAAGCRLKSSISRRIFRPWLYATWNVLEICFRWWFLLQIKSCASEFEYFSLEDTPCHLLKILSVCLVLLCQFRRNYFPWNMIDRILGNLK